MTEQQHQSPLSGNIDEVTKNAVESLAAFCNQYGIDESDQEFFEGLADKYSDISVIGPETQSLVGGLSRSLSKPKSPRLVDTSLSIETFIACSKHSDIAVEIEKLITSFNEFNKTASKLVVSHVDKTSLSVEKYGGLELIMSMGKKNIIQGVVIHLKGMAQEKEINVVEALKEITNVMTKIQISRPHQLILSHFSIFEAA